MAFYVKCNEKTYKHIGAPAQRVRLKDGNYIAWQGDFSRFPQWPNMREIAALTGSLLLQADEAYEEQEGVISRPLPEATDDRFFVPAPAIEEELPIITEVPETPVDEPEINESPEETHEGEEIIVPDVPDESESSEETKAEEPAEGAEE